MNSHFKGLLRLFLAIANALQCVRVQNTVGDPYIPLNIVCTLHVDVPQPLWCSCMESTTAKQMSPNKMHWQIFHCKDTAAYILRAVVGEVDIPLP